MSWKPEVDEIERRRARPREQGGADAVAKQHARGRATVRERIAALVDADSFREHGDVAGVEPEPRRVASRRRTSSSAPRASTAVPSSSAATTSRSAAARIRRPGLRKGIYADELAVRRRVPVVRLLEGGGASITGADGRARPLRLRLDRSRRR